ncbi:MAG TPA: hypothetical protein VFF22_20660 [Pseudomonas sp.]|nr:MAG: hypothetical protein A2W44_09770 [Acinetobacter sp. RIFCSPHIGHO2_12_41_5]HZX19266.1 hypothetical protein [Pseudomonas sp.]
MSNRANFLEPTKQALAKRAGNSCSFPGCDAITEGPSSESDSSVSKTGMACHIYAAANGPSARRVNLQLSDAQLSEISNGIWMCYSHGKLIDTDEATYTVEQLKTWKVISELRARLWQQLGKRIELPPESFKCIPLPETKIGFESLGQENILIGEAISRACVSQVWGKPESQAIRDTLIELTRNAFGHGKASCLSIQIKPKSIVLTDDGTKYDPIKIFTENHQGGGFHSIDELVNNHAGSVYFSFHNDGNKNNYIFSIVSSPNDIKELTPCHIEIPREYYWEEGVKFEVAEFCDTVYVIFPDFFALSDALKLPVLIEEHLPKGKDYVFVGVDLSQRAIEIIESRVENIKILNYRD